MEVAHWIGLLTGAVVGAGLMCLRRPKEPDDVRLCSALQRRVCLEMQLSKVNALIESLQAPPERRL